MSSALAPPARGEPRQHRGKVAAFALADKLGLDRQKMFDVVSTSSGYSWSMNAYCPAPGVGPQSPADNGYKPGFAAALMLKDLGLARAAAEGSGAATPLGHHAEEIYAAFDAAGGGGDGGDDEADVLLQDAAELEGAEPAVLLFQRTGYGPILAAARLK